MITIVGLGYGADCMSVKGLRAIESADKLYVLTEKTEAGRALKKFNPIYLDRAFEGAADFEALAERIAEEIPDGAVYAADGDGYSDGAAKRLAAAGNAVILPAAVEGTDRALRTTATDALTEFPCLDTGAGLVITEIDDRFLAGELKLKLLEYYAPDTVCAFCGKSRRTLPLADLDRQRDYGAETFVVIAGDTALDKQTATFGDLVRMMRRLTGMGGCPWDRAQTHESIRQNLIEEAYEAVDAIDAGDLDNMIEELGDVLLQAVFHCDIAARTGEFTLGDVVSALVRKLYTRHTHIFGADKAANESEALGAWEAAKAEEKSYTSLYDVLKRLPKGFPSALKAGKAVKKAAKAGASFTEKECAIRAAQALGAGMYGEALFYACAASALSGTEPETALNLETERFIEEQKA